MSKTITAYQCNAQNVYMGESLVQEDPLNLGKFLLPPNATLLAPPPISSGQQAVFLNGEWSIQTIPTPITQESEPLTLLQAQSLQQKILTEACKSEIIAGFQSDALGEVHIYPSQSTDQVNLIGAVTASQSPGISPTWTCNFWCADGSGTWALRPHTAAQIQGVLASAVRAREELSTKLYGLTMQVNDAVTVDAAQSITW